VACSRWQQAGREGASFGVLESALEESEGLNTLRYNNPLGLNHSCYCNNEAYTGSVDWVGPCCCLVPGV
jgi:hypothetical protein